MVIFQINLPSNAHLYNRGKFWLPSVGRHLTLSFYLEEAIDMRKFWQWLLLAVTGITLMILSPPIIGQAREITTVTGLDANSCIIKDEQGNVYSHTATLSPKVHYILNYHWAIPNNESIKSGDTMHFYVPDNVTIVGDRSFPMVY